MLPAVNYKITRSYIPLLVLETVLAIYEIKLKRAESAESITNRITASINMFIEDDDIELRKFMNSLSRIMVTQSFSQYAKKE